MKRFTTWGLRGLMLVLLVFAATGCDTVEGIFENEKEAKGFIEAIDGNNISLDDGFVYIVDDKTEYEGVSGLSELNVDDEVEIEYKDRGDGTTRAAVEVELAGAEDDD